MEERWRWGNWLRNEIEEHYSRLRSVDKNWGAPTRIEKHLSLWSCSAGGVWSGPMMHYWECNGFQSKIYHSRWAKCTSIFILRKHYCGLHSTGIFRQRTMNSWGCQRWSLRNNRLEILGCCRPVPQAIGDEEKLMVYWIKHFHSGEPWFLIIDDLGEVSIVKQELLNCDTEHCIRAPIQPESTDNSSKSPICQPSS